MDDIAFIPPIQEKYVDLAGVKCQVMWTNKPPGEQEPVLVEVGK